MIRLDIDPGQLDKNRVAQVAPARRCGGRAGRLVLDALPTGRAGSGSGTHRRRSDLRAACADTGRGRRAPPGSPSTRHCAARCRPGSTVAGDSSQVTYFGTAHFFDVQRPGEFLYMAGFATLGYGLPAAIGAKIADPSRAVAVLLGDGALMFSVQEIVTAVEQRLPIPIVVHGQQRLRRDQGPGAAAGHRADRGRPARARPAGAGQGLRRARVDAANADEVATGGAAALTRDRPTLIRLAC